MHPIVPFNVLFTKRFGADWPRRWPAAGVCRCFGQSLQRQTKRLWTRAAQGAGWACALFSSLL